MSGKHTPAPWVVGPVDDTVVTHIGADGFRYEVAAIDGDYNDPDTWPVMEANARLIAAAPELLERLQAIIDWADFALCKPNEFNSHGVRNLDGPVFDAARSAIAKATSPSASIGGE